MRRPALWRNWQRRRRRRRVVADLTWLADHAGRFDQSTELARALAGVTDLVCGDIGAERRHLERAQELAGRCHADTEEPALGILAARLRLQARLPSDPVLESGRDGVPADSAADLADRAVAASEAGFRDARHDLLLDAASVHARAGRSDAAARLLESVLAERTPHLPDGDGRIYAALWELAGLHRTARRPVEAEPVARRLLALLEDGRGGWRETFRALEGLTVALARQRRFAEAVPVLRRALGLLEDNYGTRHPVLVRRVRQLAALCRRAGDADAAAAWRTRLATLADAVDVWDMADVTVEDADTVTGSASR